MMRFQWNWQNQKITTVSDELSTVLLQSCRCFSADGQEYVFFSSWLHVVPAPMTPCSARFVQLQSMSSFFCDSVRSAPTMSGFSQQQPTRSPPCLTRLTPPVAPLRESRTSEATESACSPKERQPRCSAKTSLSPTTVGHVDRGSMLIEAHRIGHAKEADMPSV